MANEQDQELLPLPPGATKEPMLPLPPGATLRRTSEGYPYLQGSEAPESGSKGIIEKAIEPITSYPETYGQMRREAQEQMGRGVEQISGAFEKPSLSEGAWEAAKGAANIGFGGLGFTASPISAAYRTLLGKPIEEITGVPKEYTEFAASLATPGVGFTKIPSFKVSPPRIPTEAEQIIKAGERVGVELPKAAVVGPTAQTVAGAVKEIPIIGAPIVKSSRKALSDIENAVQETARKYGATGVEDAGRVAKDAIEGWVSSKGESGKILDKLYDKVDNFVDPSYRRQLDSTADTISKIMADRANAKISGRSSAVDEVLDAVQSAEGMNYEGLKKLRTYIGEMLNKPAQMVAKNIDQAEAKRIYAALSDDLKKTIQAGGTENAVKMFEYANSVARIVGEKREQLSKIIGAGADAAPEKVISRIESMATGKSSADIQKLRDVKHAIGDEAWNNVAGSILDRMGRTAENAPFSGDRFVTKFENLSLNARNLLFGNNPELYSSVKDLADVSKSFKNLNKLGNPSGSGRVAAALSGIFGGGGVAGLFVEPVTTIVGLIGSLGPAVSISKYMSSPARVKQASVFGRAYNNAMFNPTPANLEVLDTAARAFKKSIEEEEETPRASGGSVLDKMHAAKRRADGGPLDGPFDEAGVQHTAEGYPYIQAGDVVEAPETVAAPAPAPEEPRPGYLQKSIEGLTRGVRELPGTVARAAEDYWAKTKEEQKQGLEMAGRGISNIAGGLPATGVGEVGLGALQYLASPITGFEKPIEKTTGNPAFAQAAMAIPLGPESLLMKAAPAMAAVTAAPKGVLGAMKEAKAAKEAEKALPSISEKFAGKAGTPVEEMENLLEGVRGTEIGKMVERYQDMPVREAHQALFDDLKKLAQEGEIGKEWYEKSSARILDFLGGDKDAADKFAQLIAIYSPQTAVDVNTQNAVKAYNRALAGQPLWDGRIVERDIQFPTIKAANDYVKSLGGSKEGYTKIPLDDSGKRFLIAQHGEKNAYENIATLDRDLKAHLVMNEDIPFEGRKINNFYNNLMVQIDPSRLQSSTQDLWMARAFGFLDDAVGGGAKYDYMERLTADLAKELGWKPHQVQAAIWTAMKTRQEGVLDAVKSEAISKGIADIIPDPGNKGKTIFQVRDGQERAYGQLLREKALGAEITPESIAAAARNFSDFLDQNVAHISWESAPSTKIGHLNGFEALPPQAKAEYHVGIQKALQNDEGQDLLARYLNILSPGAIDAPGYWEKASNPATLTQIGATRIKAAKQRPDIDVASKKIMDIYASALGLLLKQDGVGYHRPYYNPQITKANGVEFKFEKPMSREDIINIGQALDDKFKGSVALIPSGENEIRVLNFGDTKNQKGFHKAVADIISNDKINNAADFRVFGSDGDLVSNNWRANPNGQDYIQRISSAGRSDVLEYISDFLAPRVEAFDKSFAAKYGLKRNEDLEKQIRNLKQVREQKSTGGFVSNAYKNGGSVLHKMMEARRGQR
jgi:hypothetical protein